MEQEFWEEAEGLIEQFDFSGAIEIYTRAFESTQNPQDKSKILDAMGDAYIQKGDIPQAMQSLTSSIQLSPEEGASKYMNMGQITEGQESLTYYQKGIELLKKEKASAQSNEEIQSVIERIATGLVAMAEIYMTDECYAENAESECDRLLNEAISINPTNPEVLQQLANFKMNQQKPQEALQYLKQSHQVWSEKEPDEWPSYEFRTQTAKYFIELAEWQSAAQILDDLIDEVDQNSEVWYLAGLSYSHFDPEEALTCLTKCKELLNIENCNDPEILEKVTNCLTSVQQQVALLPPKPETAPEPEIIEGEDEDDSEESDNEEMDEDE